MMKVLFCAYRDWAIKIIPYLNFKGDYLIIRHHDKLEETIKVFEPELIFFIGWSWIVPEYIINSNTCLCIHPSKLPKYRGGSPIQNQIIDGVEHSAVTLFIMNNILDAGNIIEQYDLSLEGELNEIFKRISYISTKLIDKFLFDYQCNTSIKSYEQNHLDATIYKRRKPKDSEITINDLNTLTATQLYNKIRCLQDPYPNPYITLGNGEKLYILKVKL